MTEYRANDNDGQTPPPSGDPVYSGQEYYAEPFYQGSYDHHAHYSAAQGQPYQGQPHYVPMPPAMPVVPPGRPRKGMSTGAIIGIAIIAALALVIVVSMVSCTSLFGSLANSIGYSASTSDVPLDDRPKIGVITIEGTIQYDGTSSSPSGLRTLLDRAEEDDSIKAVVLRVNSGGGVATAGEEMAYYLQEFSKPIVVSSAATNASAAYEISSQADYIFTAKTTSIGAIGVAFQVTDVSGLYEKLGINIESITSAESKDATYGDRPLTDEERQWYQDIVDQIDDDFVMTVAEGRGISVDEVRDLANGLPYTGADAVDNGLADEVGYYEDAVSKASELAGYAEDLDTYPLSISSPSSLAMLMDILGQEKAAPMRGMTDADAMALEALASRYGSLGENG